MREVYQTQLDGLLEELAVMCTSVGTAMRKATDALLNADLSLAEAVITGDMRIDDLRNHAEEKSFALLALQAPVATDLRVVVATIHAAGELAHKAADVIRTADLSRAQELDSDDDAMDDLHRHMFTVLMGREWTHGVASAVDVTLLARFYERYGDHAVAVARRMVYVITGQMPSAADA